MPLVDPLVFFWTFGTPPDGSGCDVKVPCGPRCGVLWTCVRAPGEGTSSGSAGGPSECPRSRKSQSDRRHPTSSALVTSQKEEATLLI